MSQVRRTQEASAPRQRLLDAADQLFYEHGINATGVDAVIAAAQVARMTFYNHFGSKDGLIAAYLKDRDLRWRDTLEEAIDAAGDDPIARVLAVFDALEEWVNDTRFRGCSFVNAAAELSEHDHPARGVVAAHKRALHERLLSLLKSTGISDADELNDELLLLFEGAITTTALDTVPEAVSRARAMAEQRLAHRFE